MNAMVLNNTYGWSASCGHSCAVVWEFFLFTSPSPLRNLHKKIKLFNLNWQFLQSTPGIYFQHQMVSEIHISCQGSEFCMSHLQNRETSISAANIEQMRTKIKFG